MTNALRSGNSSMKNENISSVENAHEQPTMQSVGSGEPVRLSLPADVCRCFGGGCADKENCQRYLARNERWPELSYIQGGAFVSGVCLYRIEPNKVI